MATWQRVACFSLSVLVLAVPQSLAQQKAGGNKSQKAPAISSPAAKTEAASQSTKLQTVWKEKLESGQTLLLKGDADAAEARLQEALAIAEKGADKRATIATLNALSECLEGRDKFADAEPLRKRALALSEQAFGGSSAEYAEQVAGYAGYLARKGEVGEARAQTERALSIAGKATGDSSLAKAQCSIANARTLVSERTYGLADDALSSALQLRESKHGPNALVVLLTCKEYADLLEQLDRKAEARKLRDRITLATVTAGASATASVASPGKANAGKDKFFALVEEAKKAADKNDSENAMANWKLAVKEAESAKRNDRLAYALLHLGDQFNAKQNNDEAEVLFKRALDLREQSPSKESLGMARNLVRLANSYTRKKNYTSAERMLNRALECEEKSGATAALKAQTMQALLASCMLTRNLSRAEQVCKALIALSESNPGPMSTMKRAMATSMLAGVYMQTGRMNEGMQMMKGSSSAMTPASTQDYGNAMKAEFTTVEKEVDQSEESVLQ